jgi:ParB family chromosome partitioning protein
LEALLGRVAAKPEPSGESPPVAGGEEGAHSPAAQPDGMPPAAPEPAQPESPHPFQPEDLPLPGPGPQIGPGAFGDPGSPVEPSGEHSSPEGAAAESDPEGPANGPIQVDVHCIQSNPFQPRQDFDPVELLALRDSLRAHGLLQPLVARRVDDRFQLIAGERRLQAATQAGWSHVPVLVVEADDREVAELAIVENLQRKDLNPLEKAASFQRYLNEFGGTQEELASRLKLDRSTIANLIRLLELPQAVQEALRQGKITQGHARALLPLGDEREQVAFCTRIQQEGLSVRRTEALVQEAIHEADAEVPDVIGLDGAPSRPRRPKSEHLAALEQEFRVALGMLVKITHSRGGRGKLVIQFASHEEFERLRRHICEPDHGLPRSQVG